MKYELELSCDSSALLRFYREIPELENRAEDHYERQSRQRGERAFFQTGFITADGKRVGLAEFGKYFLADSPRSASLSIFLHPEAWNPSAFGDLVSRVEYILRANGFSRLLTTASDFSYRAEFLRCGFGIEREYVESEYELQSLLAEPQSELPHGYGIKNFTDLAELYNGCVFDYVFQCVRDVLRDIPGQELFATTLTVQNLKDAWQGTHFKPEACFFLMHSKEPVGVHNIVSFSKSIVTSGVTGILRAYRRRGLMRHLKRRGMIWAAKKGFAIFRSENEVSNPMLALNRQLGFREIRRHYEMTKRLD